MKKTKEQKNREILNELDLEGSMKTIFEEIDKTKSEKKIIELNCELLILSRSKKGYGEIMMKMENDEKNSEIIQRLREIENNKKWEKYLRDRGEWRGNLKV